MTSDEVRLSIIVPTTGRPTLYRTLSSIRAAEVRDGDDVIVVADGRACVEAVRIISVFRGFFPIEYREHETRGPVGHPQRNVAMGIAKGTHLTFMDDDDVYVPGAFGVLRRAIAERPDRPHIFRMAAKAKRIPYDVLWRIPALHEGNVGTPMFVPPNDKARLGTWGDRYSGDFDFMASTVQKYPQRDDCVVWHEEIIAEIY